MTSNQIKYWDLRERHRNNQVTEKENERSHRANENNMRYQISSNYNLGLLNLSETKRANQAKEAETNRANLANERIREVSNQISAHQAETQRMNAYTQMGNLAELQRSNLVKEYQNQQSINEAGRHNLAQEGIQNFQAVSDAAYKQNQISQEQAKLELESSKLDELIRHNMATEAEIKRKNLVDQELQALRDKEAIRMHNATIVDNAAKNVTNLMGTLIGRGGIASNGTISYQKGDIIWPKGYK